jgi:hypothetical protein
MLVATLAAFVFVDSVPSANLSRITADMADDSSTRTNTQLLPLMTVPSPGGGFFRDQK